MARAAEEQQKQSSCAEIKRVKETATTLDDFAVPTHSGQKRTENKMHGTLALWKKLNAAQNILEVRTCSEIRVMTAPNTGALLANGSVSNTYVTTT